MKDQPRGSVGKALAFHPANPSLLTVISYQRCEEGYCSKYLGCTRKSST